MVNQHERAVHGQLIECELREVDFAGNADVSDVDLRQVFEHIVLPDGHRVDAFLASVDGGVGPLELGGESSRLVHAAGLVRDRAPDLVAFGVDDDAKANGLPLAALEYRLHGVAAHEAGPGR